MKTIKIDKCSPVALYIQLEEVLTRSIINKEIVAGDRIPSENELVKRFDISRMTVRQAVKGLVSKGYLHIKRGEGTYVSYIDRAQTFMTLDGFSIEMVKLGKSISSRVIKIERLSYCEECSDIYKRLVVDNDADIIHIKRIRYIDKTPFAVESSYLRSKFGEGLLSKSISNDFSIYKYLRDVFRLSLMRAEHTLEPILPTLRIATYLEISADVPVLSISGVTYAKGNEPIEFIDGVYRGDRYSLKVNVLK